VTADKRGFFKNAGLEVSVLTPVSPTYSIQYVVQGVDDLGVAPEPQVVLARAKGLPIVAVGSLISRPTSTLISLRKSGIRGIGDLKGKTIAIPGLSFQKAFLESLLAQAGLSADDVEIKTVGYKLVPALVSGRADAIFGGSRNLEGLELEPRGLHPVAVPAVELGLPPYEQLVVIARSDRAAREPRTIRSFLSALRRGATIATRNPEAATAAIDASDEPDPEASPRDTKAEIAATVPLLSKEARMSPGRAARLVAWMYRQGLLEEEPPVPSFLTNRYLPSQARQR
jgi:putative hydroxymethylpyrimidine transport system substrate-binding protein